MRAHTQLEYRNDAMMKLRGLYFGTLDMDSKTVLEFKRGIFKFLKEKKVPKTIITYVRGYEHALYDRFMTERIVYLYEVQGQLYKTKDSTELNLPNWDELPRELQVCLGEYGGFYYRDSFKKFA